MTRESGSINSRYQTPGYFLLIWFCIIFICPLRVSALYQDTGIPIYLNDNFDIFPGDDWSGDTDFFRKELFKGLSSLRQSGDSGRGTNFLTRESIVTYGEWEFSVHFDGFATSNQNRAWVWLSVDQAVNPTGFAVRIGENGSQKHVRIYELRGSSTQIEILRSVETMPENVESVFVNVHHTPDGTWRLGTKYEMGSEYNWTETDYVIQGNIGGKWFGLNSMFTSTRSDKFLFGPILIKKYPIFLKRLEVSSRNSLILHFSENIEPGFLTPVNVEIPGYSGSIHLEYQHEQVHLILSESLPGGQWPLLLKGLIDESISYHLDDLILEFNIFEEPGLFDVVINEFTPRPSAGNDERFIELFNRSEKHIDLDGWQFGRQNQAVTLRSSRSDGLLLKPGGIALFGPSVSGLSSNDTTLLIDMNIPVLGRTTDHIWLKSNGNTLIDSIRYDNKWSTRMVDGKSLQRRNPNYASMDPANWDSNETHHSAGIINSNFDDTPITPNFLASVVSNNSIHVYFDRFVRITGDTKIIAKGNLITDYDYSPWTGNEIVLKPNDMTWLNKNPAHIEIMNLHHFDRPVDFHIFEEISQPATHGSLIINEIMYQPLQDRYASFGDQSEYIELLNMMPYKVSLSNVFIRDTKDKNGIYRAWVPENHSYWSIEANDYAVIFPDTAKNRDQMRLPQFFGIEDTPYWARVDRSTLGLTASGRGVYIESSDIGSIDSVYYTPDWHHPLIRDPRGISLERVFTNSAHRKPVWTSSADYLGGTPGRMNSARFVTENSDIKPGLSLTPNPFSPDNDAYNDYLQIRIDLDHPGYMLKIRVFDRYGKKIKDLTGDEISGNEFITWWDGLDNNNNLSSTGVYVVHVEGKHHSDLPDLNYKETLVLVRKR